MTNQQPRHAQRSAVKTLLVAGVVIALLAYGLAGVLVRMLGASHFHRPVAESATFVRLEDIRRPSVSTARHEHGLLGHTHTAVRRHVHDGVDPSQVTLGADEPADEGTPSGAACQPGLLRDDVACAEPGAVTLRWPRVSTACVSVDADRIERPPRA
jgi:hypothetical protein